MEPCASFSTLPTAVFAPDRPLLVNIVARMTRMSCNAVRWNVRHGCIKAEKDPLRPKIWLFHRSDVEAFIARRSHVQSN